MRTLGEVSVAEHMFFSPWESHKCIPGIDVWYCSGLLSSEAEILSVVIGCQSFPTRWLAFLILHVWVLCLCVCACAQITASGSQDLSYRWLWGSTWVLGTGPCSSGRAVSAPYCWAFSAAPGLNFLKAELMFDGWNLHHKLHCLYCQQLKILVFPKTQNSPGQMLYVL